MRNVRSVLLAFVLAAASFAASAEAIDINQADASAIAAAMTGVGPVKARAIVAYRDANGPFRVLEDLAAVEGIGERTIELNRENVHFGSAE